MAAARGAQVWSRAQLTRQQMQDAMTQGLYEKSADSQEGVLHTVLNQMADQHTKEVMLAYAVLLQRGMAGWYVCCGGHSTTQAGRTNQLERDVGQDESPCNN